MQGNNKPFLSTDISAKQNKDTGMAMVLLLLLLGYFSQQSGFFHAAIPVLFLNMTVPRVFYPLAILWFGMSNLLGTVMSRVLLSLVFILIVLPVAMIRKWMGKDSLRLTAFAKGSTSVLTSRNHVFVRSDLEKPF